MQFCLSELIINILQIITNNGHQIRKYFFRNTDKNKTLIHVQYHNRFVMIRFALRLVYGHYLFHLNTTPELNPLFHNVEKWPNNL